MIDDDELLVIGNEDVRCSGGGCSNSEDHNIDSTPWYAWKCNEIGFECRANVNWSIKIEK